MIEIYFCNKYVTAYLFTGRKSTTFRMLKHEKFILFQSRRTIVSPLPAVYRTQEWRFMTVFLYQHKQLFLKVIHRTLWKSYKSIWLSFFLHKNISIVYATIWGCIKYIAISITTGGITSKGKMQTYQKLNVAGHGHWNVL